MSLPAFILDDAHPELKPGDVVSLGGPEGRHAVTVKRLGVGEQLAFITDCGLWLEGTITAVAGKDTLQARLDHVAPATRRGPEVVLIQALPKSDRSEMAIDLATQAGVDTIVPFQAHRCIAKWAGPKAHKGITKWQQAARAAAKQSRRPTVPHITELATTVQLALRAAGELDALLVLHEQAATRFADIDLPDSGRIGLVVGPEGGLSDEEVEAFTQAGGTACLLGPEVLRCATAAMVATAAIGARTSRW